MPATSPAVTPEQALERAEPMIHRLARKLLGRGRITKEFIEDGEQHARLHLLQALPKFDHAKGGFCGFAYRTVHNSLASFRRSLRARHRQAAELTEEVRVHGDDLASRGADKLIDGLMTRCDTILGKRRGRLFALHMLTNDRAELADILGVSTHVADQQICRLRKDLRALVAA